MQLMHPALHTICAALICWMFSLCVLFYLISHSTICKHLSVLLSSSVFFRTLLQQV